MIFRAAELLQHQLGALFAVVRTVRANISPFGTFAERFLLLSNNVPSCSWGWAATPRASYPGRNQQVWDALVSCRRDDLLRVEPKPAVELRGTNSMGAGAGRSRTTTVPARPRISCVRGLTVRATQAPRNVGYR